MKCIITVILLRRNSTNTRCSNRRRGLLLDAPSNPLAGFEPETLRGGGKKKAEKERKRKGKKRNKRETISGRNIPYPPK